VRSRLAGLLPDFLAVDLTAGRGQDAQADTVAPHLHHRDGDALAPDDNLLAALAR